MNMTTNLRKAWDIAFKEVLHVLRSPFVLGLTIGAPLLMTGLIYFAFGGMQSSDGGFELAPVPVGVVNLDVAQDLQGTPVAFGTELVTFLQDDELPDWVQATVYAGPQAETLGRQALEQRQVQALVIIPPDFTEVILNSGGEQTADILLLHDPTLTLAPMLVKDLLGQFTDGVSGAGITIAVAQQAQASGAHDSATQLEVETQMRLAQDYAEWFTILQKNLHHSQTPLLAVHSPAAAPSEASRVGGTTGGDMAAIMAKVMAGMMIFFVFFSGANTALSIVREDEEGTLARLFTTPTAKAVILGGKYLSVLLTVLIQTGVLLLASALLFHIQWGSPLNIALSVIGLAVGASGLGVLVAANLRNTRQAGPVIGGAMTAMGMLGGLMTTAMPMPAGFTQLNRLMPQGWALHSWQLTLQGASAVEVLPAVGVLLALGAVFFAAGVLVFRKRFG